MNKVNPHIIIIILTLMPVICNGENWIDENIELTINNKFSEALSLLNERLEQSSEKYEIYFYFVATLHSKMTHFENFDDEHTLNAYADSTINIIESKLQSENLPDSTHAKLLFYLGSTYGYLGFLDGRKSNWYSAMSNGLEAKSLFEQAVELDSTLYEAYLGIGAFKYWLSSKIKFALWLPFVPDGREEGIAMIKKSLKSHGPSRFIAMHQLIYILLDYGRYDEAVEYAEKIVEKYPESQFMWWAHAHAFYKRRDYERAISAYNRLLQLLKDDPDKNPSHIVECNLKLAQLYLELKEYPKCISYCQTVLKYKNNKKLFEVLEDKFEIAKEYLEQAEKQQNEQ